MTRAKYQRVPPFARTARPRQPGNVIRHGIHAEETAELPQKSLKLVTKLGAPTVGPLTAMPMNPAVLVPTPSIALGEESYSST
jgi:hypothetical protein